MTKTRYLNVKNHTGIRKDTLTGRFQARKKIAGVTYTETFCKVSEAIKWRESFWPSPIISHEKSSGVNLREELAEDEFLNGRVRKYTFKDVWEMYINQYLPSIEIQSSRDTIKRAKNLFPDFYNINMTKFSAELIDQVIFKKVNEYHLLSGSNQRRISFKNELKTLKAVLNRYRENYDVMFVVPVLKRHFIAGIVKKRVTKRKSKMTPEQSFSFFNSLDHGLWADFAKFHFYMAGRAHCSFK